MRLIDADAFENKMYHEAFENDASYNEYNPMARWDSGLWIRYKMFENVVADAPSIDIEPKRGEWVKRTHNTLIAQVNFAYCSECGQPIMHEHTRPLWSFCPNCGADMRKESE